MRGRRPIFLCGGTGANTSQIPVHEEEGRQVTLLTCSGAHTHLDTQGSFAFVPSFLPTLALTFGAIPKPKQREHRARVAGIRSPHRTQKVGPEAELGEAAAVAILPLFLRQCRERRDDVNEVEQ